MKLYLFGPITGHPDGNKAAFDEAAALLGREHFVYNPHDIDVEDGFEWLGTRCTPEEQAAAGFDLESAMRRHLRWITTHADGIVGLPGWQESSGSRREVLVAKTCGIPIYVLVDGDPTGELYEIDVLVAAQVNLSGWPAVAA